MVHLLLLGDSLVADNDWQQRMPAFKVSNLGTPGAMASDLRSSLTNAKADQPHADVIMVMIGTNDLLSGNFKFIETLKEISVKINSCYPLAELVICSLFPMDLPSLPQDTIPNLNAQIKVTSIQTGSCFLDTYERFKNSEHTIFQDDNVHITPAAYEIWARTLIEHIAFLIQDD